MTHPFAFPERRSGGNSGAWNEVHDGDHVIYLITGKTGTLDECLHDGDAFVTWDDGTFGNCSLVSFGAVSKGEGDW